MKTRMPVTPRWVRNLVAVSMLAKVFVLTAQAEALELAWHTTLPMSSATQVPREHGWGVTAVGMNGNVLYCGMNGGVLVFDVADRSSPTLLSEFRTEGTIRGLVTKDHILYLLDNGEGVISVDMSDAANPTRLDTANVGDGEFGGPRALALLNNRAYVAVDNAGLAIVDISDPSRLVLVGHANLEARVSDISISNGEGYVILGVLRDTVARLDLSSPDDPRKLRELYLPSLLRGNEWWEWWALADGGMAYSTAHITTVSTYRHYFWNLHDFDSPTHAGNFIARREPLKLSHDGKVYSTEELYGEGEIPQIQLAAYRFGSGNPKRIGHLNPEVTGNHRGHFHSVAVSGHHAYATETYYEDLPNEIFPVQSSRLEVIDVSMATQPRRVGRLLDISGAVAISGDRLVAAPGNGLAIVDISDPTNPNLTGRYQTTPVSMNGVAVSGTHAYLSVGGRGGDGYAGSLEVIDISVAGNPRRVGEVLVSGGPSVVVSTNHAFLANENHGLRIIDISDPTQPRLSADWKNSELQCVAVEGRHAYVVGHGRGLEVIDVGDPANPLRVGGCFLPGLGNSLAVSGNYAYVATWYTGLYVIDISDPANPRWVGHHSTRFWASEVVVHDGLVFVADETQGLTIFEPFRSINLGPARLDSQGHMQIELSTSSGQPIRIQRSGNLLDWDDWLDLPSSEHPITITDPDAERAHQRFYRAVELDP